MVSDSSSSKHDDSKIIGGDGGTQIISKGVREAIDFIKEAVGNHPDADIYDLLQESNMDPNETAQKLLFKDPFHEVKRKKDKKKENIVIRGASEPRRLIEQNTAFKGSPEPSKLTEKNSTFKGPSEPNSTFRGPSEPRRLTEHTQGMRSHVLPDRYPRKSGYIRNSLPAVSQQFRVVRDNRVNQNTNREEKHDSVQSSTSARVQTITNVSGTSTTRIATDKRHINPRNFEGQKSSQAVNGPSDFARGHSKDAHFNNTSRKGASEENRAKFPSSVSQSQGQKQPAASPTSNNNVVGLYSSSSDPVHVPSNSRSSGSVGAIRREVGVVGIRRPSSENPAKQSSVNSSSVSTPPSAKEILPVSEPLHPSSTVVDSDQLVQPSVSDVPSIPVTKSLLTNQPGGKSHQQSTGHQKASQSNKEWKPKSSQKSSFTNPVVSETATTQASPPNDNSTEPQRELSQVTVSEIEHVFIPQHLRVPEADRTRLTFGSFGLEVDNTASNEDLVNGQARDSGSASPASTVGSEQPSPDNKESGNLENYEDIGSIVRDNTPSYSPAEPQQHQQHQESPLPSYAAYDPQSGYEMPFYRPMMDESTRNPTMLTPGEVSMAIPASSVAMVQQQLYPQMQLPHYPNYMHYRQYMPPVYMPPMGIGYSSNPGFPHPSNGSSYVLMPGGSSHIPGGGVKYGASQYKPIPTGYASGLDDSSRMKYKDGNLYVPNPQAETSEMWIQTPREIPGPYYNIQPGQAHHAAAAAAGYLPTQTGHMQFPGLYPPQQATGPLPHHMLPNNVGVAAAGAPGGGGGAQIGTYQQPQMGHLNWNTNF